MMKNKNNGTQPTQGKTEEILKYIIKNIEPVNFKLEKHSQRYEFKAELDKLDIPIKVLFQNNVGDEKNSKIIKRIKSELEKIKLYKTDYKVIATDEIIRVAKELGYPLKIFNASLQIYNGVNWESYQPKYFKKFLRECYLATGIDRIRSSDADFLQKGFEQFQATTYSKCPQTDDIKLNFQNGTLEFNQNGDFNFRDNHRSEDYLTYVLPYNYNEDAKCPEFINYLGKVVPEKQKQLVLAEFIGSVFSNIKHEKVLILFGDGQNGKSVFLDIITALLGTENVSSHSLEKLTGDKLYFVGYLADKLLNYTGEISTKVNPDMFKKLTSGEKVVARNIYKSPYEIENYARLAFNCNKLPRATEKTKGFYRRFLIIPFEVFITEDERDPDLAKNIIKEELPGILNWVLEGLKRLEREKEFSSCPSAEAMLEKYKMKSDTVGQFLEDIEGTYYKPQQSTDLYNDYKAFCRMNKLKSLGHKDFSQELEKGGVIKRRQANGYFFYVDQV